jgi:DNA-binding transcriptional ArsR family regulator
MLKNMKPLFHPSVDDVTVEGILHALADPVRVAIFANIVSSVCSQNCSTFLCVDEKTIPRSTLSQHFRALREAGLIRGERRGVEMHNTPRCMEIEQRFPGLIQAIISAHKAQAKGKARQAQAAGKRQPAVKPGAGQANGKRPAALAQKSR